MAIIIDIFASSWNFLALFHLTVREKYVDYHLQAQPTNQYKPNQPTNIETHDRAKISMKIEHFKLLSTKLSCNAN